MKLVKYFAYGVVLITIVCLYGWMVYYTSTGGSIPVIGKPLHEFAKFPQTVQKVFNSPEVQQLPKTYIPLPKNYKSINQLDYDVNALTAFWNKKEHVWELKFMNLRNDSIYHEWVFKKDMYTTYRTSYPDCIPFYSLLLANNNILVNPVPAPNLMRLDASSNVVWRNTDYEFHHTVNVGVDGNVWLCGRDQRSNNDDLKTGHLVENLDEGLLSLWDNYILKIDIATGNVLYNKPITEIFLENDLKSILYGTNVFDPLHMNDIQPVLEDGPYMKKDDLLISLRSQSLVLQFRPATNELIRIIQGPFVNQHDIDILSDHEISIFNNNSILSKGFTTKDAYMEMDSLNSSEIIIYNFEDSTFRTHLNEIFLKEKIKTRTQGLSERLTNGDVFIEAHNTGEYYIINDDGVVYHNVFYTSDSNYIHMPSWMRIIQTTISN